MGDTAISWTHRPGTRGRTWNPTKGCSRISEGCRHCYAESQAARIVRMNRGKPTVYDDLVKLHRDGYAAARWTGKVILDTETLAAPLKWRWPSTVFVNSMSDLFHESLTNEQIAAVFGVMAACPRHTFQCLTKRAGRMRAWFEWIAVQPTYLHTIKMSPRLVCRVEADKLINPKMEGRPLGTEPDPRGWPLPNVWLGVSVENQDAADERIPLLLQTPAAVRFLSCEPLLGPVELPSHDQSMGRSHSPLDWIISGCESGPGARPCDIVWLRSLRDQCAAAGVPFFLKQGTTTLGGDVADQHANHLGLCSGQGSRRKPGGVIELPYLDGKQHVEWPT